MQSLFLRRIGLRVDIFVASPRDWALLPTKWHFLKVDKSAKRDVGYTVECPTIRGSNNLQCRGNDTRYLLTPVPGGRHHSCGIWRMATDVRRGRARVYLHVSRYYRVVAVPHVEHFPYIPVPLETDDYR